MVMEWWRSLSFDRLAYQPVRVTVNGRTFDGVLEPAGERLLVNGEPVFQFADGRVSLVPDVKNVNRLSVGEYRRTIGRIQFARAQLLSVKTLLRQCEGDLTSAIGRIPNANQDEQAAHRAVWLRQDEAFQTLYETIDSLLGETRNE